MASENSLVDSIPGYFWMGNQTLKVPYSLHSENRQRLVSRLTAEGNIPEHSFILLQGGSAETRYDTDTDRLFRQESFFQWAFGVIEPDFYGAIEVRTGASILFIPELPASYGVWLGTIQPPSYFKAKYGVDEVRFTKDLENFLASKQTSTIFVICGTNTDSNATCKAAHFTGIERFSVDKQRLFPHFVECRLIKTEKEIEVMRYVARVSSEAHKQVMRHIQPGMREYQLESVFLNHIYYTGGCRNPSYTCICATGPNGAILHYGHAAAPNDRIARDGDMCLFDMGGEYHCYCSDITCCFPVNGVFSPDQKIVYNAVLDAQQTVEKRMKHGTKWSEMHRLAEARILSHLLDAGILHNGTLADLENVYMGSVFMPHGLGHLLGLDTHDVGGYPVGGPERSTLPGLNKLRFGGSLAAGMVVTVEPGLYFIDYLLDAAINNPQQSKYINVDILKRFRGVGGVRLEDDVLVTRDGCEVLNQVPRTVEEVETWMQKK